MADFNARTGTTPDPRSSEGWSDDRALSSEFIETIVLYDPYRTALSSTGVRIAGAWFPRGILLDYADIAVEVWLTTSRFDGRLSLIEARAERSLDFTGSYVGGPVRMPSIRIEGSLFMGKISGLDGLFLARAEIRGDIVLSGAIFAEKLDMDSADVGGLLVMNDKAHFAEVHLRGAKVGDAVDMRRSTFTGLLNLNSIDIGGILAMRDGSVFNAVDLRGARIRGNMEAQGSRFADTLNMDSAEIGGILVARTAEFSEGATWDLLFTRIGAGLDLSGAKLDTVDATGALVGNQLALGSPKHGAARWSTGAKLILRNASLDAIQDISNAWPETLELDGLTYRQLGGYGAKGAADMAARDSGWFIDWLARDPTYSPQPYEQLAAVLTKGGQPEKADEILYAGRERQRLELQRELFAGEASLEAWLDFFWKSALHAVIGYGYKVYRAFYWVAAFVILGTVVIWWSRQLNRHRIATGATGTPALEYSIDMLLPIIELRKQHYDIDLTGPVRYYFYFHKLMGFVLVSFLIAGLAGLTK